jgi:hypothetical protein
MIELRFVNGGRESLVFPLTALPISGGRGAGSDVALTGLGIWDSHFRIELDPTDGVILQSVGDAFTTVDQQRVSRHPLRNGDVIECGTNRVQFWLTPAPQRRLRSLEAFVWILAAMAGGAQVAVANWIGR